MSLYIDVNFINQVSGQLDKFKQKSQYLFNCRCPFCGDSKKSKSKARGYFYRRQSNMNYTCHNCHVSISLGNFLKQIDYRIYEEYRFERYKNENPVNVKTPDFELARQASRPVILSKKKKLNIPSIEELEDKHPARKYVKSRKIPREFWKELYYTPSFKVFVEDNFPSEKDKATKENDRRLIIPFYDAAKNLLGVQGRALYDTKVRYITIKIAEESEKIFGLERLDKSKTIYVVEGPIDSLFIDNCVATMDSKLYTVVGKIGINHNYVFVFDNQPRNRELIADIEHTLRLGLKVAIFPNNLPYKDINDIIVSGCMDKFQVKKLIDENTFDGLKGLTRLASWRKL